MDLQKLLDLHTKWTCVATFLYYRKFIGMWYLWWYELVCAVAWCIQNNNGDKKKCYRKGYIKITSRILRLLTTATQSKCCWIVSIFITAAPSIVGLFQEQVFLMRSCRGTCSLLTPGPVLTHPTQKTAHLYNIDYWPHVTPRGRGNPDLGITKYFPSYAVNSLQFADHRCARGVGVRLI